MENLLVFRVARRLASFQLPALRQVQSGAGHLFILSSNTNFEFDITIQILSSSDVPVKCGKLKKEKKSGFFTTLLKVCGLSTRSSLLSL